MADRRDLILAMALSGTGGGGSGSTVVEISDAAPVITADPGARYLCTAAAVTSLNFTPSATGICSVRFTSGATPTSLTMPGTVKMPDWWTGVEASRTYEISIADGVWAVVTSWA